MFTKRKEMNEDDKFVIIKVNFCYFNENIISDFNNIYLLLMDSERSHRWRKMAIYLFLLR